MKLGLENKLSLEQTLSEVQAKLPINLNQSLSCFQKNEFMKNLFGLELHQHLWAFYNLEYTEFMNQVDEWELNRYLYNI